MSVVQTASHLVAAPGRAPDLSELEKPSWHKLSQRKRAVFAAPTTPARHRAGNA
jgi:hypothetical protein